MSYKGEFNQWSRAISARQAWNCENAIEARCRCRCRGLLHGAGRLSSSKGLGFSDPHVAEELAKLPEKDPHFVKPETEHPLGPLRKVVKREKVKKFWPYYFEAQKKRGPLRRTPGNWILTLECGHQQKRKLSRRPPKKLHCKDCKTGDTAIRPAGRIDPINEPRQENFTFTPTAPFRNAGKFRSHAGRAYRTKRTATD